MNAVILNLMPARIFVPPLFGTRGQRWWKFRAEGFTPFGREIRAMLREEDVPELPVHVNVRPKMALFDGLDLPVWLDEDLCQLLNIWPTDFDVPDDIMSIAAGRVPVRCVVASPSELGERTDFMRKIGGDPRFDGLTIYESNATVWSPAMRQCVDELRSGNDK